MLTFELLIIVMVVVYVAYKTGINMGQARRFYRPQDGENKE